MLMLNQSILTLPNAVIYRPRTDWRQHSSCLRSDS